MLSDQGNQLSSQYNLTLKMQKTLIESYQKLAYDLPEYNGKVSWELPLAATFVINQLAEIIYVFVDTDHRKRADPTDVLKVLSS